MSERSRGDRPTKTLQSAADATAYQRRWFADLQLRVAGGEPLVLVNADAPQEIFRAMDIPYVVNQWWASVIAAKQRSSAYLDMLAARGYPTDADPYSAVALGSLFDPDPQSAPWGGLPKPELVVAELAGDATRGIFETWALESGATFFAFEKSVSTALDLDVDWWERMPTDWEHLIGVDRIDLMTEELNALIELLERMTGRTFDAARLVRVLDLINEQEHYFRRARDLIASTVPAPVDVIDTIAATMIPQWHRGTEWGRDAAKAFYEEIESRVAGGASVCGDERVRLMWLGRGVWFDLPFYAKLQETHGAVFVWSMYLAIAADGYIRQYEPAAPLRSVAGRFAAFADQIHMPGWASEWHVKEARRHQVDGVVQLDMGGMFSALALERSGIPVLRLDGNNVDPRLWDRAAVGSALARFIETRVAPVAARRRARQ